MLPIQVLLLLKIYIIINFKTIHKLIQIFILTLKKIYIATENITATGGV
jgi:hypothetical protein